jgi:hypothetical protein
LRIFRHPRAPQGVRVSLEIVYNFATVFDRQASHTNCPTHFKVRKAKVDLRLENLLDDFFGRVARGFDKTVCAKVLFRAQPDVIMLDQ